MVFELLRNRWMSKKAGEATRATLSPSDPALPAATTVIPASIAANDRTGFLSRKSSSTSVVNNTMKAISEVTANVSADAKMVSRCTQSQNIHADGNLTIKNSNLENKCTNKARAVATLKALADGKVQQQLRNKLQSMAESQIKNLPTSVMSSTNSNSIVKNYVESVSRITHNAYSLCGAQVESDQSFNESGKKDVTLDNLNQVNNASLDAAMNCIQQSISKAQEVQTMDNTVSSSAKAIDAGFNPFSWLTGLLSSELLGLIAPAASSCCLLFCCCMIVLLMFSGGGTTRIQAPSVNPAYAMQMAQAAAAAAKKVPAAAASAAAAAAGAAIAN